MKGTVFVGEFFGRNWCGLDDHSVFNRCFSSPSFIGQIIKLYRFLISIPDNIKSFNPEEMGPLYINNYNVLYGNKQLDVHPRG
jgi:hypothetical protein